MRILVIDDSQFMRRLVCSVLKQLLPDAEVTDTPDARQGLAVIPEFRPDLVTVDMLMPGMTGLEFLTELSQLAARPRVIVISADVQKAVRQRCADLGATDFIDKPITVDKLQAAFSRFLAAA